MSKYRILIVDDDEDARRLLTIALGQRYETVEASDGLDALSKLEILEPDMAIIDIMMPMMDGYQVCEAIRKNHSYQHMPVIFLSAFGSTENVKKSYAVGANLFLTKPVDPDRVLKNIDFTVQREPPPLRNKKYSIAQLKQFASRDQYPQTEKQKREQSTPQPKQAPPHQAPQQQTPPHQAPPQQTAPQSEPQPDPQPDPHTTAPPHASGMRPRVLAVDDDQELLEMVEIALREDFEVTVADNGLKAIECLVDYEPDVMVLDIMMPKMNGYQLLQSVRRNQFFKEMPVVVLSAKSTPKDREYAKRLGANDFIAKPYSVDSLLGSLNKVVRAPGFAVRRKKMTLTEIHERLAREVEAQARKKNEAHLRRERATDIERNFTRED